MPSKIEKKFIDNLENFTDSLDNLVELLKTQHEKGGDAINTMLSALDDKKIKSISEDMKLLVETTTRIDSRTKEILSEVKAARKAKEGGVFTKISDTENKGKIVDGIKVILLISVGVLALGMAFKLIGNVDLVSVIALSIAMYTMSKAFESIGNVKNLSLKKASLISGIMVLMSGGILFSSLLLRWVAPISIITGFSIVFISVTLGLATYLLVKAFEKVDLTNPKVMKNLLLSPIILPIISLAIVASSFILQLTQPLSLSQAFSALLIGGILGITTYLLLKGFEKIDLTKKENLLGIMLSPIILPMIALGIVASSYILSMIKTITPGQALSALVIGGAMGVATYFLLQGLSKIDLTKKENIVGIMLSPVILPLIALGIVASSYVLSMMKPLTIDYVSLIKLAASIGLATLAFLPTIIIINKFNLSKKDILTGSVGILLVSSAIVASSLVFSLFQPLKVDGFTLMGHSIAMGISLITFLPSVYILSKINSSDIAKGILGTIGVSAAIMASSWILSLGKYEKYPTLEWSAGVGLSLLAFGASIIAMGLLVTLSGGLGAGAILVGSAMVLLVASSIVATSYILSTGKYTSAPPLSWAASLGLLLPVFGASMLALGVMGILGGPAMVLGGLMILGISKAIAESSKILSTGNYTGGPTYEWSRGIATSISSFVGAIVSLDNADFNPKKFESFINSTSNAMTQASKILSTGTWDKYPTSEWNNGVRNTISTFLAIKKYVDDPLIDSVNKFADAIKNLSDNFSDLNDSGISKLSSFSASINVISSFNPGNLNNNVNAIDANKQKIKNITNIIGDNKPNTTGGDQTTVQGTGGQRNQSIKLDSGDISGRLDKVIKNMETIIDLITHPEKTKNAGRSETAT